MGDNFLEGQAKNTKKRRDKASKLINTPTLFQRPDELIDVYTLDCLDGVSLKPGEILRCFPGSNETPVEVAQYHQNVGKISESGGGLSLQNKIKIHGVGKLIVRNFNELTSSAQVEQL